MSEEFKTITAEEFTALDFNAYTLVDLREPEELIDGVELGGVSTFLGSGEQSDMSLFI